MGDFNICDPEKDGSKFGTKLSLMATQERLLCSILSFHMYLKLPNLITPGEMPRPLVLYAPCPGLIVSFSIYLWLKHVISTARLMLLRTLGRKPFRVTMLQYASSSRNLLIEDTRTNVFPVGCPNIPFLVLSCSNFITTTDSLLTRLVRCLNSKFFYTKLKR